MSRENKALSLIDKMNGQSKDLVIFRAFLSPIYFALLSIICLLDTSNLVLISLLSALFHETAHLIMGYASGQYKSDYCFRLPIMSINNSSFVSGCTAQAAISAAGPIANFLLFAVLNPFARSAAIINLALFMLNALPVSTLDGGQVIFFLLLQWKNPVVAYRISTILSYIVIIPLLFCGCAILITTGCNFSLLAVGIYLLFSVIKSR